MDPSKDNDKFDASFTKDGDCPVGKFVKLHNKSEKDVTMVRSSTLRTASNAEVTYKLNAKSSFSNASVTKEKVIYAPTGPQNRDYDALMAIKEALDVDIDAYKKLFENDATRGVNRKLLDTSRENASLQIDVGKLNVKVQGLSSRHSFLESTNNSFKLRVSDLEAQLKSEREDHAGEISFHKEKNARLQEQMSVQLEEYQDLMEIKVALDMEIGAYRKILEIEEARVNITPGRVTVQRTDKGETPNHLTPIRRGMKHKRIVVEESFSEKSLIQIVT